MDVAEINTRKEMKGHQAKITKQQQHWVVLFFHELLLGFVLKAQFSKHHIIIKKNEFVGRQTYSLCVGIISNAAAEHAKEPCPR